MPYLLNGLYLLVLIFLLPVFLWKSWRTGKYRRGMGRKLLGRTGLTPSSKRRLWLHAVSVGEVLLLKPLISRLQKEYPEREIVLSTTTNTGFGVAMKTYPDMSIFYFPLDFTWAVHRALDEVRPEAIILTELELWPNFIHAAHARGIPIALINGRMSPKSFRGYRRIRWFVKRLLGKLTVLAAQNEDYADRLILLGASPGAIAITGSLKYDGLASDRNNEKTRRLANNLGMDRGPEKQITWVVGSTQAPEEQTAIEIYKHLRKLHSFRMILVPRHQERFEEVAALLQASGLCYVRRSRLPGGAVPEDAVILMDTLGELSALWGLAEVAFVGGSLSQRGGQNMIEPAAYGAAVTFGPNTWNFRETVDRLLEHEAAIQVKDAAELQAITLHLIQDAETRHRLGQNAQRFVLAQHGATEKTMDALRPLLDRRQCLSEAA